MKKSKEFVVTVDFEIEAGSEEEAEAVVVAEIRRGTDFFIMSRADAFASRSLPLWQ